jgi:hypothetical protein
MKISLPAFLGYRDRAKAAPAPSDCLPTSADGPITSSRISACPTTSLILKPPCDSRRLWRLWRLSVRYSCPSPIFPWLADGALAPCLAIATTRDTLSLLADMGLGGRFFDMSRNTCAGPALDLSPRAALRAAHDQYQAFAVSAFGNARGFA